MKKAILIHNPSAGDSKHTKERLLEQISLLDFQVQHISIDREDWREVLREPADALFVAGGDGTFHKVAEALLEHPQPLVSHSPIYLIALGTANNIVKTLLKTVSIEKGKLPLKGIGVGFDCGVVTGIPEHEFFLEGMGLGIFPELIYQMKNKKSEELDPEQKLRLTLNELLELAQNYKAQKVKIKADGLRIRGRFILMELMNIRYVGPNLDLAPHANTEDGFLELVMIPESAREGFISHLKNKLKGEIDKDEMQTLVKIVQVKKVSFKWPKCKIHVDDSLLIHKQNKKITLTVNHNVFKVMA